jgi:alkane 1-monooxygenase
MKTEVNPITIEKEGSVGFKDLLPTFIPVIVTIIGFIAREKYNNPYLSLWLIFAMIPVLDTIFPLDMVNFEGTRGRALEKDKRFLIPLYTMMILDFAIFYYTLVQVRDLGIVSLDAPGYMLVLGFIVSLPGGINITGGHELLHRKEMINKVAGTLIFGKNLYAHYFIQHVKGHHKDVGTTKDSSTALYNENFYAYMGRAVS